jgi:hypothetical protein
VRIHPTILAAVLAGGMLFTLVPCGHSQEKRETVESRVSIKTSLPPGRQINRCQEPFFARAERIAGSTWRREK